MRLRELKVKRMSLAAEQRILRREFQKSRAHARANKGHDEFEALMCEANRLHEHKVGTVRPEARIAHIAHAFMRGKSYASAEVPRVENRLQRWQVNRLEKMVKRFGGDATGLEAWLKGESGRAAA